MQNCSGNGWDYGNDLVVNGSSRFSLPEKTLFYWNFKYGGKRQGYNNLIILTDIISLFSIIL